MRLADEMPAATERAAAPRCAWADHDVRTPNARARPPTLPRRCGCSARGPDLPAAAASGAATRSRTSSSAPGSAIAGLEAAQSGLSDLGIRAGQCAAVAVHAGANLVPVNADAGRDGAPGREFAGPTGVLVDHRAAGGGADLWRRLAERWGHPGREVRDVRPRPAGDGDLDRPLIDADPRRPPGPPGALGHLLDAAVKMYTEEVGVSPVPGDPAVYRARRPPADHLAAVPSACIEDGRVLFKAELGSVSSRACQVQGVWLDPALRGRGLAAPAMAAVVQLARTNRTDREPLRQRLQPARAATYTRVGFSDVGDFATVLY